VLKSRLTGSELQDQEEAACACTAFTTTGELFTGANVVKFVISHLEHYHLAITELIHSYYLESVN